MNYNPDTPCIAIYAYIDPSSHPNVGIYGSPMECLDTVVLGVTQWPLGDGSIGVTRGSLSDVSGTHHVRNQWGTSTSICRLL